MIPTSENCANLEETLRRQLPQLREATRKEVQLEYLNKWNDKVKSLVMQGDFINLLISEQSNVTWQSIIYGVPRGVMGFAMRSATNTLATPDNLRRWKKTQNDTCKMCKKPNTRPSKATLFHILNHCTAFLGEQERFRWRHDSVLSYMTLTIKENVPDHIKIYADLDGHKVNGQTLPQDIVVTASRPDLVIVDSSTPIKTVYLFELSVCFEQTDNIQKAHQKKYDRYCPLTQDIEDRGFNCKNIPFEVGSRGHLTLENKSILTIIHKLCNTKTKFKKFYQNISKTSLLCSYSIYLSREENWNNSTLLSPVK